MKIAIISSGFLPVIDGVTVSAMMRLQRLSQWGHEVLFFCPDYSTIESIYPNWREYTGNILPGVRVCNIPSTSFLGIDFERNPSIQSYSIVLKELEQFQPDIIHVDEPERLFFGFFRRAGIDYAKKAKIPCIAFFRTWFLSYAEDYIPLPKFAVEIIQEIFRRIFAWIYNSYDITLFTSKITYKIAPQMGIKNAVYSNLAGFEAERFDLNLKEDNFFGKYYNLPELDPLTKLVFVGRLTPDKGWSFTLKAMAKLAKQIDLEKVGFIIVGDGQMKDEIINGLAKYTRHVYFLGRVPYDQVPAVYANSDIHITTSERESRGLTVLEAFASGIPVLVPRAGGLVENVQDGENGLIYTPQDPEDFTQKLKQLIDDPILRKTMGQQGLKSVGNYSWDRVIKNLVEIWEQNVMK
ncbi:putative glycosyltransferase MJ1178 [Planktothrix tepida]|uniref:Glycosyltransferase n=1 Tax=Planktothrix tepida PCC 9214 TaxID=671072 RepID=A0A1J1LER7_9CYAN|nr:glycosyltransferase family 4 protein [Planktothrix tepida]CAD5922821.1 putative glycosyltransferase MJ1178 [Planktothrix tepida]CUR31067.1 Glycosyltransferase [Planktothrix tepida PCC 9214]